MAAGGNGAAGGGADTKAAFAQIYKTLKEELLADPAFEFTAESHQWIDRVNIPPPSFLFCRCLPCGSGGFLAASPRQTESSSGSARDSSPDRRPLFARATPGSCGSRINLVFHVDVGE